jgi:hypothetical protein
MKKVDVTSIHRIFTRYYGSRHMTMDTNVEDKNFINPYSMKLIFDYDPTIEIDYIILLRKLRRYIFGVHFNLNIIQEENKIQIYVIMYDKPMYKDYGFEFSSN